MFQLAIIIGNILLKYDKQDQQEKVAFNERNPQRKNKEHDVKEQGT
jgi:hypothetical protein